MRRKIICCNIERYLRVVGIAFFFLFLLCLSSFALPSLWRVYNSGLYLSGTTGELSFVDKDVPCSDTPLKNGCYKVTGEVVVGGLHCLADSVFLSKKMWRLCARMNIAWKDVLVEVSFNGKDIGLDFKDGIELSKEGFDFRVERFAIKSKTSKAKVSLLVFGKKISSVAFVRVSEDGQLLFEFRKNVVIWKDGNWEIEIGGCVLGSKGLFFSDVRLVYCAYKKKICVSFRERLDVLDLLFADVGFSLNTDVKLLEEEGIRILLGRSSYIKISSGRVDEIGSRFNVGVVFDRPFGFKGNGFVDVGGQVGWENGNVKVTSFFEKGKIRLDVGDIFLKRICLVFGGGIKNGFSFDLMWCEIGIYGFKDLFWKVDGKRVLSGKIEFDRAKDINFRVGKIVGISGLLWRKRGIWDGRLCGDVYTRGIGKIGRMEYKIGDKFLNICPEGDSIEFGGIVELNLRWERAKILLEDFVFIGEGKVLVSLWDEKNEADVSCELKLDEDELVVLNLIDAKAGNVYFRKVVFSSKGVTCLIELKDVLFGKSFSLFLWVSAEDFSVCLIEKNSIKIGRDTFLIDKIRSYVSAKNMVSFVGRFLMRNNVSVEFVFDISYAGAEFRLVFSNWEYKDRYFSLSDLSIKKSFDGKVDGQVLADVYVLNWQGKIKFYYSDDTNQYKLSFSSDKICGIALVKDGKISTYKGKIKSILFIDKFDFLSPYFDGSWFNFRYDDTGLSVVTDEFKSGLVEFHYKFLWNSGHRLWKFKKEGRWVEEKAIGNYSYQRFIDTKKKRVYRLLCMEDMCFVGEAKQDFVPEDFFNVWCGVWFLGRIDFLRDKFIRFFPRKRLLCMRLQQNKVQLVWDDLGCQYYEVYRKKVGDYDWVKIADVFVGKDNWQAGVSYSRIRFGKVAIGFIYYDDKLTLSKGSYLYRVDGTLNNGRKISWIGADVIRLDKKQEKKLNCDIEVIEGKGIWFIRIGFHKENHPLIREIVVYNKGKIIKRFFVNAFEDNLLLWGEKIDKFSAGEDEKRWRIVLIDIWGRSYSYSPAVVG